MKLRTSLAAPRRGFFFGSMPPVRTLFVIPYCDFPPKAGAAQRMWRNISVLSRFGPTAVFSVDYNECPESALPGVDRWRHVDERKPVNNSRARRAVDRLIRLLFPPQYRGLDLAAERRTNHQLRQFISEFQPTVVVLDHWRFAVAPTPLKSRHFPLIAASHNVEWQLLRDLSGRTASLLSRLRANAKVSYFRRLEALLYRSADRTWAVSDLDRRAIQCFTGLTSEVRALPIVTDVDYYEPVRREVMVPLQRRPRRGPTVFYAGAYWWQPNADAAHMLTEEIYPILRATYPGARLLLIGDRPTTVMNAAAAADRNVVVTGKVDDVRPYLAQSDVVAVPLLIGGGMRSKILEAFAAGIPVVSTTKGAEGIDVADGRELLVRDGAADFAAGIQELWDDPGHARQIVERGLSFVRRDYSMEAMEARVRRELEELAAAKIGDNERGR